MNIPYIDKRSKNDIIEYIKKTSHTYTPEWKFDEINPDIGTALALIYSDMHYETLKRFNKIAQKSMFDFFNNINTSMLPAVASEGYVSFNLSSENLKYDVEVKSGTNLMALRKGNQILFKTMEDVLVNNSKIQCVYLSNGNEDIIVNLFDADEDKKNIELFNISKDKNIQEHIVKIYHSDVFNIDGSAYAGLKFIKTDNDNENISKYLEYALDNGLLKVQYYSANGYVDFEKVSVLDDGITAYKAVRQPAFKYNNKSFEIRLISKSENLFADKMFKRIECFSKSKHLIPDAVLTGEIEKSTNQFYPFNERPFQYDEFYIASKDAFCKKGAVIDVSFYVDFDKIPVENEQTQESQMQYKLIMKHSQFKPEEKFDITIDNVIWEYFNGKGWAKLFRDNQYEDIFHPRDGRRTKTVSFICPDDIQMVTVNSRESFYIRAKILKINNQFKSKGTFITPLLSEICVDYCYKNSVIPEKIICMNNTQKELFYGNDFNTPDVTIEPFKYLENKCSEVYFGFNNPPEYGPVRFLFCMKDNVDFETIKLKWSYLSSKGWEPLTIFDETENFRKTGAVTLIGNSNFKLTDIFGKSAYWIKAADFQNGYNDKKNKFFPEIEEVHNNVVSVMNITDMPDEIFSIEPFEENKVCNLSADMIYHAEVWVDEISNLTPLEIEELKSKQMIDITYDVFGIPMNMWVKWHEVKNFGFSAPDDRHFKVDKNMGTVIFGDNIHGKIPSYKNGKTIKIKYSVGGGNSGNVGKGEISKISEALGFVTDVYNPMITHGGADIETVDHAISRTSARLRNCNRAVTVFDYETLVREAERNILKVKCIPNMLPNGKKSPGNIIIVLLIEDYDKEKSYFISVKDKVEKYISSRMSGNLYQFKRLHIIQPQCVYYNVKAEAVVKSLKNVFEIKSRIERRIDDFLNINTGNFNHNGWDIGVLPNTTQMLNAIKDINGISFIKNISVTPYINIDSHMCEADINNLKGKEFSLAFSGIHDIIIKVE